MIQGEANDKCSPLSHLGLEMERPSMLIDDDGAGDRQPLTGSFPDRFRREKGVEDPMDQMGWNASARVRDDRLDKILSPTVLSRRIRRHHLNLQLSPVRHGLDRIQKEIEKNLMHLALVDLDSWQLRMIVLLKVNTLFRNLAHEERKDLVDNVSNVA